MWARTYPSASRLRISPPSSSWLPGSPFHGRRTARAGALTLTSLYAVFTLLWLPEAFLNLGNFDPIGNVFEEFSLVAAGLVLCAIFSPAGSFLARHRSFFVLLFGICPISFGIVHIVDMPGLLSFDPGLAAAEQDVLGLRHHHGFFRGCRSHPRRHHGTACVAAAHCGDRDLRVAFLDSEAPAGPRITPIGRATRSPSLWPALPGSSPTQSAQRQERDRSPRNPPRQNALGIGRTEPSRLPLVSIFEIRESAELNVHRIKTQN